MISIANFTRCSCSTNSVNLLFATLGPGNRIAVRDKSISCITISDGDDITFAVSDDGSGVPENITPGRGLAGMADRAEALGGSVDPLTPLPFGGATVRGRIPAAAAARRPETA